jgi:hypothetical protein
MNRDSLISLRTALNYAEEELGIQRLSELEKKLYYAAVELADNFGHFSSEVIRNSKWCKDIPHASYHRALANLVKEHIFLKEPGSQRNYYCLPKL